MKFEPVGFMVLIKMDVVEEKTESGIVIATSVENERENRGHDVGEIVSFGPLAFTGYDNCNGPSDYGVSIGDKVEFRRYDGKIPRHDEKMEYRIIFDSDIILKVRDE